jgi:hypothetical protein
MKAPLGHMSKKMIERYFHIRAAAKRKAVEGLSLAKPVDVMPEPSSSKNGCPQSHGIAAKEGELIY